MLLDLENLKSVFSKLLNLKRKSKDTIDEMYPLLRVEILRIQFSGNLVDIIFKDGGLAFIEQIGKLRKHLTLTFGFILPSVNSIDNSNLKDTEFCILIREKEVFRSKVYLGKKAIHIDEWEGFIQNKNQELNLKNKSIENFINELEKNENKLETENTYSESSLIKDENNQVYWIDLDFDCSLNSFTATEFIILKLKETVFEHIDELFLRENLYDLLNYLDVKKVYRNSEVFDFENLFYIVKNLLKKQVSIKDLEYILDRFEDFTRENISQSMQQLKKTMGLRDLFCFFVDLPRLKQFTFDKVLFNEFIEKLCKNEMKEIKS